MDIGQATERQIQAAGVEWFRSQYPKYDKHLQASLNGIYLGTDKKAASIRISQQKKAGMVVGQSDLFLAIPIFKINCAGLYVEVKREGETPTKEQLTFIDQMVSLGYSAQVCAGVDALISAIDKHMKEFLKTQ